MTVCRGWQTEFSMEALQRYLLQKENGIVLLNGYSGCGKTQILKGLKQLATRPVYLFSYRDVVDEIIKTRENCYRFLLELDVEGCVIGVEDVDYLDGKSATQKHLADMIRIAADKHLIILTGNDVQIRTPFLHEFCEPNIFVANAI